MKGTNPELPPIMIGSHTDSVVGGGRFDGIIGVLAGIEIVRQLNEKNIQLAHSLLIVDFTGEEASEFGISTIGSRGMVGNLTEDDSYAGKRRRTYSSRGAQNCRGQTR